MRTFYAAVLFLAAAALQAQSASTPAAPAKQQSPTAPTAAPAGPQTFTSDLGFSYIYAGDWEVVDTKPMMPAIHQQLDDKSASDPEKKAASCVHMELLLRKQADGSMIMAVSLPYECYGTQFAETDLPGFGTGVAQGLKTSFDIQGSEQSTYSLGTHKLWIERAKGNFKGHPELSYTIETVCSLLKKGAVCWIGMGKDADAVQRFESGQTLLEGDATAALVPPTAFDHKEK